MKKSSKENLKDEETSIRVQICNNLKTINSIGPVISIQVELFNNLSKSKMVDEISKAFHAKGDGVERVNFGFVRLDRKLLDGGMGYLHTQGEFAAFYTVPSVIKHGKIIYENDNQKGRLYHSWTMAAPVEINGIKGIVAVVVRQTKDLRYKVHRIAMPDGTIFNFENKKIRG